MSSCRPVAKRKRHELSAVDSDSNDGFDFYEGPLHDAEDLLYEERAEGDVALVIPIAQACRALPVDPAPAPAQAEGVMECQDGDENRLQHDASVSTLPSMISKARFDERLLTRQQWQRSLDLTSTYVDMQVFTTRMDQVTLRAAKDRKLMDAKVTMVTTLCMHCSKCCRVKQ